MGRTSRDNRIRWQLVLGKLAKHRTIFWISTYLLAALIFFFFTPFVPSSWQLVLVAIGTAFLSIALKQIFSDPASSYTIVAFLLIASMIVGVGYIGFLIGHMRVCPPLVYPRTDGKIADFTGGRGGPSRNVFGENFNVIVDSEWNGKSKCWYERCASLEDGTTGVEGNGFLRIYYEIPPRFEKNGTLATAYIGVFTDFSYPPPEPYDVSNFSKVSLRIRLGQDIDESKTQIIVALATSNIPPCPGKYDWCEYSIPNHYLRQSWTDIQIPFDTLQPPFWTDRDTQIHFDPKCVFRFVIAMRSIQKNIVHGHIDIDDVRFE